jgi:hypothetical protein
MIESKPRGIARLLDFPRLYSRFADCIGGDARSVYTREYVRPAPGQRIIDIGCGPADNRRRTPRWCGVLRV